MCGVAGFMVTEPGRLDPRAVVERIQMRLTHRGPDDRGLFSSDHGCCALAHTRLSILDLSPAGHQPMSTADGRYWIVFNGEIYNYAHLRRELEQSGETFTTGTDTEVILGLCSSFASGTINAGNSCWLGILLALNRFIITLPGMPSDLLPNCERYLQAGCCQGS